MPRIHSSCPPLSSIVLFIIGTWILLSCWSVPILAILHRAPYTGPTTFLPILWEYLIFPFGATYGCFKGAFYNDLYEKRLVYTVGGMVGVLLAGVLAGWDCWKGTGEVGDWVVGIGFAILALLGIGLIVYVEELWRRRYNVIVLRDEEEKISSEK